MSERKAARDRTCSRRSDWSIASHHFPSKLSGGERQRVAIARSLANGASVLLADEPTGNLDSENARLILDLIVRLHDEQNITLVLVTHDMGIAARASRAIADEGRADRIGRRITQNLI